MLRDRNQWATSPCWSRLNWSTLMMSIWSPQVLFPWLSSGCCLHRLQRSNTSSLAQRSLWVVTSPTFTTQRGLSRTQTSPQRWWPAPASERDTRSKVMAGTVPRWVRSVRVHTHDGMFFCRVPAQSSVLSELDEPVPGSEDLRCWGGRPGPVLLHRQCRHVCSRWERNRASG